MDGLRAFAALWVLAYHCWNFGFSNEGAQASWLAMPFAAGHLGVPIFLVLSGFCLAHPYLKKGISRIDVRAFAVRRAVRIAPPYWICTLVFAALSVAVARSGFLHVHAVQQETDLTDLAWHVGMIQNLSADHFFRINGALWSVALECQLYIVFPLLMLFADRPKPLLLACGLVSVLAWGWAVEQKANGGTAEGMVLWTSVPSFLIIFVLGIASARWFQAVTARPRLLAGVGAGLLLTAIAVDRIDGMFPIASVLLAAIATVCLLLAGRDSPSGAVLTKSWMVRIGLVSYTLYLIHNPVVSFGGKFLRPRLHGVPLVGGMLLFALVAVGAAFALYPLFERPFHLLAKRMTGSNEPVPLPQEISATATP